MSSAEKLPLVSVKARTPLTLTVAPGEVVPDTVMDLDVSRGLPDEESSRTIAGVVRTGGIFRLATGLVGLTSSGVLVVCGLGVGLNVGRVVSAVEGWVAVVVVSWIVEMGVSTVVSCPQPTRTPNARTAGSNGRDTSQLSGPGKYRLNKGILTPASCHTQPSGGFPPSLD